MLRLRLLHALLLLPLQLPLLPAAARAATETANAGATHAHLPLPLVSRALLQSLAGELSLSGPDPQQEEQEQQKLRQPTPSTAAPESAISLQQQQQQEQARCSPPPLQLPAARRSDKKNARAFSAAEDKEAAAEGLWASQDSTVADPEDLLASRRSSCAVLLLLREISATATATANTKAVDACIDAFQKERCCLPQQQQLLLLSHSVLMQQSDPDLSSASEQQQCVVYSSGSTQWKLSLPQGLLAAAWHSVRVVRRCFCLWRQYKTADLLRRQQQQQQMLLLVQKQKQLVQRDTWLAWRSLWQKHVGAAAAAAQQLSLLLLRRLFTSWHILAHPRVQRCAAAVAIVQKQQQRSLCTVTLTAWREWTTYAPTPISISLARALA